MQYTIDPEPMPIDIIRFGTTGVAPSGGGSNAIEAGKPSIPSTASTHTSGQSDPETPSPATTADDKINNTSVPIVPLAVLPPDDAEASSWSAADFAGDLHGNNHNDNHSCMYFIDCY